MPEIAEQTLANCLLEMQLQTSSSLKIFLVILFTVLFFCQCTALFALYVSLYVGVGGGDVALANVNNKTFTFATN